MSKYVDVTITRKTAAITQDGFGKPLILSTEKAAPYKEYSGDTALASIGTDFGTNSKTYALASALLGQNPRPNTVATYGILKAASGDMTTALNTLILSHNDFFYLLAPTNADADIEELSTWANSQDKLYFGSTLNDSLATTLNSDNTILLVHDHPETYPAAAWVGVGAPLDPGSFTWTFKTLNGINPAAYTSSEVTTIENNNASTYIAEGGVNITSKGVTTSGEYIDVIQSQYYIKSKMTQNVFNLLATSPKVPFTDAGIGLVVAAVDATLKDAFNNGIIATDANGKPQYTITAPTAASVLDTDKANRTLPNVKWSCTISGAIEDVTINGELDI